MEPALTHSTVPTDPLRDWLRRAAVDGHTALLWTTLLSALSASGVDAESVARAAVVSGEAVAVLLGETRALALAELVRAEQDVADAVELLFDDGRLRLVVARELPGSREEDAPGVISHAHLLGSADLAGRLREQPAAGTVVLSGDPDLLGPFGPGAPYRDLLAAARRWHPAIVVEDDARPISDNDDSRCASVIADVVRWVRRGQLAPAVTDPDHTVALTGADDDVALARRVGQLVTDSIPRVHHLRGAEIGVVTPLRQGACGVAALQGAVGSQAQVCLTHDAQPATWPAAVAVFPGTSAGVLDRPTVLAALTRAERHLSIAVASGTPMAAAVRLDHRHRTTILPTLLAQIWDSPSPSPARTQTEQLEQNDMEQNPEHDSR